MHYCYKMFQTNDKFKHLESLFKNSINLLFKQIAFDKILLFLIFKKPI